MKIRKYLTQSPIFALYRAQNLVVERFQQKLKRNDVHLLQGLILTAIFFEDKEVRPIELQSVLKVEKSNLSHALRGLERKGLITRSMHLSDARGYLFSLTPAGRKSTLDLIKEFDKIQDQIEGKLGKKTSEIIAGVQELVSVFSKENE